MTELDYKELDRLFADNNRMLKALTAIGESPTEFSKKMNLYSKAGKGTLAGLIACANIANQCLKENEDGREKETSSKN